MICAAEKWSISMDWLKPLDEYRERVSSSSWSEPVNTLSNVRLLIATYFVCSYFI